MLTYYLYRDRLLSIDNAVSFHPRTIIFKKELDAAAMAESVNKSQRFVTKLTEALHPMPFPGR
jgi:hypothetical protein